MKKSMKARGKLHVGRAQTPPACIPYRTQLHAPYRSITSREHAISINLPKPSVTMGVNFGKRDESLSSASTIFYEKCSGLKHCLQPGWCAVSFIPYTKSKTYWYPFAPLRLFTHDFAGKITFCQILYRNYIHAERIIATARVTNMLVLFNMISA